MENEFYGIDFSAMPSAKPTAAGVPSDTEPTGNVPPFMPDNFVVAIAYVPFQNYQTIYDAEQGFKVGTIFPELNKPFLAGERNG